MRVGEAGGREDGAALDAGLEALLHEGEALEVGERKAVGGALVGEGVRWERYASEGRTYVDDGVFKHRSTYAVVVDCALSHAGGGAVFEVPAASLLVVCEARSVVAFVEVLEHGGEDFGLLGR